MVPKSWYCARCGSPQVYGVQPSSDASGRTALGFCGIANDEERHGCSFRGEKGMALVLLIDHQQTRVRRGRSKAAQPEPMFPGESFAGELGGGW